MSSASASLASSSETLIGPVAAPDLHVMTYNLRRRFVRYLPGSKDRWSMRAPLVAELLRGERPALLGSQEAMHLQAVAVLRALGDDYRRIGHGRNSDGHGEGCPVFYDATRLRLADWHQIALSPTPEVPGSRGFGNMVPRIAVVADFEDLATGRSLRHINTHLDHISQKSRLRSIELLLEIAAATDSPIIVTGDMNTGVETKPHTAALASGALVDAWRASERRLTPEWGTYSAYRAPSRGKRIDWILTGPQIRVTAIGINTRRFDGQAPSDHEPVQAVVRW
ncbi:MAG: endonuclease/exonuclease/phosphatase family protein [Naasia sp.]